MFAVLAIDPGGAFWTRPHLVQSSEDEVAAIRRSELPPARTEELRVIMSMAATALHHRPAQGRC